MRNKVKDNQLKSNASTTLILQGTPNIGGIPYLFIFFFLKNKNQPKALSSYISVYIYVYSWQNISIYIINIKRAS